jgi:hypothetical protein
MKISKITILNTVFIGIASTAMSQAPPVSIQNYICIEKIAENGELSGTAAEQTVFIDYVKLNWSTLLDGIETIAPKTHEQMLIIAAAEHLKGRDYIKFFHKLFDRKSAGEITQQAFENAVVAITPKKTGMFAYNHQDSQVRQLIQRIQGMVPKDNKLQPFLAKILSGDAADGAEFATVGQGLPAPEILPEP